MESNVDEWIMQQNQSEAAKTKLFKRTIANYLVELEKKNKQRMSELKQDSKKTMQAAISQQTGETDMQNKKIERMRLVLIIAFLVMGMFMILNVYLLVYIFRQPAGGAGTAAGKVVSTENRKEA